MLEKVSEWKRLGCHEIDRCNIKGESKESMAVHGTQAPAGIHYGLEFQSRRHQKSGNLMSSNKGGSRISQGVANPIGRR